MRIENANPQTMKVIETLGKVAFWIFATSFAFALSAATVEIIKTNATLWW